MPLYEYECRACGKAVEEYFGIDDFPRSIDCECGGEATKTVSVGGIQDDHPVWIESTNDALTDPDLVASKQEKKIESRTDLRRVLAERGLVQSG